MIKITESYEANAFRATASARITKGTSTIIIASEKNFFGPTKIGIYFSKENEYRKEVFNLLRQIDLPKKVGKYFDPLTERRLRGVEFLEYFLPHTPRAWVKTLSTDIKEIIEERWFTPEHWLPYQVAGALFFNFNLYQRSVFVILILY